MGNDLCTFNREENRDLFIEVREITVILVQELKAMGFNIKRVLADSLDKEETRYIREIIL